MRVSTRTKAADGHRFISAVFLKSILKTFAVFISFISAAYADSPQTFMLQGTILTPAGLPQEATSVAFTIEIRSPGMEDCLLYREAHTLNMANSGGAFSLAIGSGTRTGGGFQETSTLKEVFDNAAANRTGLTCVTGTDYDATSGHTREIAVTFNDGGGPQTLTQVLQVQSVPYALYAENTAKLGGFLPTDLIRVNTLTRALSQSNLESVFFNQARVDELNDLLDGASSQYVGTSSALDFTNNITMSGAGTSLAVTNASTFGGIISANNATASTSTGTGALVVAGGIGVAGAVNSGSTISAATSMRTPIIYGSSAASGTLTLQSTSDATKGNILINPDGGNVGIGTTSPSVQLEVAGIATQNIRVRSTGAGNHAELLLSPGAGGRAFIDTTTAGASLFISQGGTYVAQFDTTNTGVAIGSGVGYAQTSNSAPLNGLIVQGNVGIGTTTPTVGLQIVNSAGADAKDDVQILSFGAGVSPSFSNLKARGTAAIPTSVLNGDQIGSFSSGAWDGSAVQVATSIGSFAEDDFSTSPKAFLNFYTNGGTGHTERMRISAAGNVGIGTAAPGNLMTASKAQAGSTLVEVANSNSAGNAGLGLTNSTGFIGELVAVGSANPNAQYANRVSLFSYAASDGMILATEAATDPIVLSPNQVDTMTLLNGSVGIGTTTPGAILDVTDASTTTSAIIVPRAGNFSGINVNGMIRYNTSSTLFEFYQNGSWVNYTTVSDGRLKAQVESVENGLEVVNQLRPVYYDWNRTNPKASSFQDKHQIGFIAQEVERALPEVVNQGEDGYLSLEYDKMVSIAIAAIKELYSKLVGIKADQVAMARELASLKGETTTKASKTELDYLRAENAKLRAEVEKQDLENAALKVRLEKIEEMLKVK